MNSLFAFDEPSHTYTYAGVRVPSVTEIIGGGKPDCVSEDRWNRAADFGTAVHKATAYHDRGMLDEATVDENISGYLDAWKRFVDTMGVCKFISIERAVYSLAEWYAGTVDRVFELNGEVIIGDIKSGQKTAKTGIQCAGYGMALQEMTGIQASRYWGVYLREGKYRIEEYPKAENDRKWKRALVHFRTGTTNGGNYERDNQG